MIWEDLVLVSSEDHTSSPLNFWVPMRCLAAKLYRTFGPWRLRVFRGGGKLHLSCNLKKKQNKVFTMYEKEHCFRHSVIHVTRAFLPGEPVRT